MTTPEKPKRARAKTAPKKILTACNSDGVTCNDPEHQAFRGQLEAQAK